MAKRTNDDLFEGSTMTFGEHIEELRVCLFRALAGVAVGCVIGFFMANSVVRFFQSPLENAMTKYYLDRAMDQLKELYPDGVPYEVEQMVVRDGLVPDEILLETSRLVENLRTSYGLPFELPITSYQFVTDDLSSGLERQLASRIVEAGATDAPSPERRIWLELDETQQATLRRIAEGEGAVAAKDRTALTGILNSIADSPNLSSSKEFASLEGIHPPTVERLRSEIEEAKEEELKSGPGADRVARLNKMLLAGLFPEELRAPRLNMVSLPTWRPVKVRFQVLNAQEAFMIWMKAALVTGIVISAPWIFYQIWLFVAAGLYPHEKNYVYLYLPISILLFLAGASLAFFAVFEPVLNFLFQFNRGMNADFDPRIGEWLSFVLILPLGFGVSFQLPLVMLFLNRIGVVSLDLYTGQWRIAILIIFLVAMVLTPADPISMLLMALPLCLLYLIGILMCKYMPQGRNPFAEAYEP
jgi:sec-independent protein translocase protein TatC